MQLDGYTILQIGWEDAGTRTYRGTDRETGAPVLIRVPRAAQPTREHLAAMRRDYDVARSLDAAAVVRPLALVPAEGGLALVLEDDGTRPLAEALSLPVADPGRFLPIALHLAQALAEVHRAQVVHKNLQPHSSWLHRASQRVRLADFSLAARTTLDGQPLSGGGRLEGRLEYIAPEQTGRMNRAVDHRTDHYALGVVLYQLLTGRLPFASRDPLELIRAHLARQPAPPHALDARIPEPLSAIVLKLLAKTGEERYQSAEGLRLDLAECLAQWRAYRTVTEIVPGQRDRFEAFRISQKLYGREAECAVLLDAFERVSEGGTELLVVVGAPGVGKSMLVNEVQKPIARSRGYFIDPSIQFHDGSDPRRGVHTVGEHLERKEQVASVLAMRSAPENQAGMDETVRAYDAARHQPPPEDEYNVDTDPLLVNTVGSWADRPEARPAIANFFLAGDYVRNFTQLACMEGGNEAGRRAVNELLRATGSSAEPCELWPLHEPVTFAPLQALDQARLQRGLPALSYPLWITVPLFLTGIGLGALGSRLPRLLPSGGRRRRG